MFVVLNKVPATDMDEMLALLERLRDHRSACPTATRCAGPTWTRLRPSSGRPSTWPPCATWSGTSLCALAATGPAGPASLPRPASRAASAPGRGGRACSTKTSASKGHIIDSLTLPQVLDDILALGGDYRILDFQIGQTPDDTSTAVLRVEGRDPGHLEALLERIERHGAQAVDTGDAVLDPGARRRGLPRGLLLHHQPRDLHPHRRQVAARWTFPRWTAACVSISRARVPRPCR